MGPQKCMDIFHPVLFSSGRYRLTATVHTQPFIEPQTLKKRTIQHC